MKKVIKVIIILAALFTMILNIILRNSPQFVEKVYSTGIDKPIREGLSLLTGIFPFSLAELLVITLIIILLVCIIKLLISIKKGGFINRFLNITTYLSILYMLFLSLWGFNYDRPYFSSIAGLKVEKSSETQLYKLCESLIDRANDARKRVHENSQGVMDIPGGYKDVFKRVNLGYIEAEKKYPELGGKYGSPKPILLSEPMLYTGITGIYIPYTGEANVNVKNVDMMLPCTVAHEMAHQRGFAREDEANYIAYVVCTMHPDADFQYSGILLALVNSMNAFEDTDFNAYKDLTVRYSDAVRRDLQYNDKFWQKYEGQVQKVADKVNDTYIKSNGQSAGVQSYGMMVDLLLAEYRAEGKL